MLTGFRIFWATAALGFLIVWSVAATVIGVQAECAGYGPPGKEACRYLFVLRHWLEGGLAWIRSDNNHAIIVAFGTVLIAAFTASLWWSTRRLWQANKQQSADMRASIVQQRLTAAAAQLSAKTAKTALETLERPYVFPTEIGHIHLGDTFTGGTVRPYIRFSIGNYGKSPALLHRVQGRFTMIELPLTIEKAHADNVAPGETQISEWTNSTALAEKTAIAVGRFTITHSIEIEEYNGLGRPKVVTQSNLFFLLTIEYENISGVTIIAHSCWRWVHPGGTFARHGGKAWNYEEQR